MTNTKAKRSDSAGRQGDANTYTGILAKPPPQWTALTRPPPEEVDALIDAKMKALLEHYQINPRDAFEVGPRQVAAWADLAFALARAHVPGLRGAPKKQGRPPEQQAENFALFVLVELFKRRDGLSQTAAVRRIAKEGWVEGTTTALEQRYKRLSTPYREVSARMIDQMIERAGPEHAFAAMEESFTEK